MAAPLVLPPTPDAPAAPADNPPDLEVLQTLGAHHGRRWPRRLAVGVAALLVLSAGAFFFARGQQTLPADRYDTAEVTRGDLTIEVTATGTLQPVNQVDVGAEVSGRIKEVLVDFNDEVTRGQVLARLDTELVGLQVKQARAQAATASASVTQAEAGLKDAERNLERTRSLRAKGLVSEAELDAALSARDRTAPTVLVAKAQLRTAWASLEMAQANLRRAEIVSPIDGTVIARQIEPGQVVISTLQAAVLFKLAEDLKQMRLTADIDEADIGRIRAGQTATFDVSAYPDQTFAATLTDVRNSPKAFQQVVTYEALFTVDNQALLLRPGMTATVRITTATHQDRLSVPNAALRFEPMKERKLDGSVPLRPKGARIWTVGDDGTAVPLDVKRGGTDGVRSIIEGDGVEEGLEVILSERALPGKGPG